eukprot:scaffold14411_cov102-Skeletonema_marinoi.AAC.3
MKKMKTRPEGLTGTPEQGHMYISVRSRLHIYDRYAHNFILIPMYKLDHLPPSIQLQNELATNIHIGVYQSRQPIQI